MSKDYTYTKTMHKTLSTVMSVKDGLFATLIDSTQMMCLINRGLIKFKPEDKRYLLPTEKGLEIHQTKPEITTKKCYKCKKNRERSLFGQGTTICNICRNLSPPDYNLLYKPWREGSIQRHYFSNNRIYGGM